MVSTVSILQSYKIQTRRVHTLTRRHFVIHLCYSIPMTPKTRKRLLRLIFIPVIVLILLVGVALALLYSQQQRLVGLAVKELNKKFPGQLAVGGSEISLFQNLPYISIALNKVQFYPNKQPGTAPIYEAERLYV